jgi:polyisoprenoid-binding protein YceI
MLTKLKGIFWAPLMSAVVANASPILMDMSRSHVEISVKATIDSFVAQLQKFDLSVTATPQSDQIEAAVFRLNFVSVRTGNADRDRDMNEWQQTDRYPDVAFTLTALEPAASGISVARGHLRLHGVDRSVSFPVLIQTEDRMISIDGDVAIDTRDYGLPVIKRYFFLKVDPFTSISIFLGFDSTSPGGQAANELRK